MLIFSLTSILLLSQAFRNYLHMSLFFLFRVDTTRVEFTISLRENWSLPFFALQVAAITCYLRPQLSALQQVQFTHKPTPHRDD